MSNISEINQMVISLRAAVFDREEVTIARGIFEKEVLREAAIALELHDPLVKILVKIENSGDLCAELQSEAKYILKQAEEL